MNNAGPVDQHNGQINIFFFSCSPEIPDNLRLAFRPTCLIKPDVQKLTEVWLRSAGFADITNLSSKLALVYKIMNENADVINASQCHGIKANDAKVSFIKLQTKKKTCKVFYWLKFRLGLRYFC